MSMLTNCEQHYKNIDHMAMKTLGNKPSKFASQTITNKNCMHVAYRFIACMHKEKLKNPLKKLN